MPRVPLADDLGKARLGAGPQTFNRNVGTPDDFGASIGRAAQGFGQAVSGAGDVIGDIAKKIQKEQNNTAYLELTGEFQKDATALRFESQEGLQDDAEGVLGGHHDRYTERLETLIKERGVNDNVAKRARQFAEKLTASDFDELSGLAFLQGEKRELQAKVASSSTTVASALARFDPEGPTSAESQRAVVVNQLIARTLGIDVEIDELAALNPDDESTLAVTQSLSLDLLNPEDRKIVEGAIRQYDLAVIDRTAKVDPSEALSYMEQHAELLGDTRQTRNTLTTMIDNRRVTNSVNLVMESDLDIRDAQRKAAQDFGDDEPELRAKAKRLVYERHREEEQIHNLEVTEVYRGARAILNETKSLETVSVEDRTRLQNEGKWEALEQRERRMKGGEKVPDNWDLFFELQAMAADEKALEQFLELDYDYIHDRGGLSERQLNRLADLRSEIILRRSESPGEQLVQSSDSETSRPDPYLRAIETSEILKLELKVKKGIDIDGNPTKGDLNTYSRIGAKLERAMNAHQSYHGRPPTQLEIQKNIELLLEEEFKLEGSPGRALHVFKEAALDVFFRSDEEDRVGLDEFRGIFYQSRFESENVSGIELTHIENSLERFQKRFSNAEGFSFDFNMQDASEIMARVEKALDDIQEHNPNATFADLLTVTPQPEGKIVNMVRLEDLQERFPNETFAETFAIPFESDGGIVDMVTLDDVQERFPNEGFAHSFAVTVFPQREFVRPNDEISIFDQIVMDHMTERETHSNELVEVVRGVLDFFKENLPF